MRYHDLDMFLHRGDLSVGKWTFEDSTIRKVLYRYIQGDVLNACCGKTVLTHPEGGSIHRNDLNQDIEADTHQDVTELNSHLERDSFDTVIFDPPYDQNQADEHYDSMHAKEIWKARRSLIALVKPGGRLVEFGWNSVSISDLAEVRGWKKEEVHLFQRGPNLHEIIMTVDERVNHTL